MPNKDSVQVSQSNPRVLFVTSSLDVWGAEQSMLDIASGLDELGVPVGLATRSLSIQEAWLGRGLHDVHFVDAAASLGRLRVALIFGKFMKSVPGAIIVFFHLDVVPTAMWARGLTNKTSTTNILDLHNIVNRRSLKRLRLLSRYLDGVVGVSKYVLSLIPLPIPMEVVERPISRPETVPPVRRDYVSLGLVGRVDRSKHLEIGIRAAASMDDENIRVVLRGQPSDGDSSYLNEIQDLGGKLLGDKFVFEGKVPKESALVGIDVLLFTNHQEPSGRVVAEAQMLGIPVVGPDRGGASEFVEDGITGMRYISGNVESMAAGISWVIKELETLSISTRRRASERYSASRQAQAYLGALLAMRSTNSGRKRLKPSGVRNLPNQDS